MDRWRGKVAIVTGVSSGIGASIAEKLVEHGVVVAGFARRVERVEALSEKLLGKPGKLHAVQCDVSKEEDILKGFEWVKRNLGPFSILINNTAVLKLGLLSETPTSTIQEVVDTNFVGLAVASREAIKHLVENKIDGHIVHINSVAGHNVDFRKVPELNVYYSSKYGVTALTEGMRQELIFLKNNSKVSSVSPGVVLTEMAEKVFADKKLSQEDIDAIPKLYSEDIANGVIYVLGTPPHVQIHELTIKPVGEPFL